MFLSRDYWLIVAPRKFDVLKTNICPRSEASRANMLVLRTSNFQGATIRPIVPRHKHSIVGSCVLKASVDRVSVDTLGRYVDRQSADMSTDTRPICRPRLGRYIGRLSVDTHVALSDHVYLRHLSTEYRSILSADMSTDSRPIYRPILGRYVGRDSVDISADCRSIRMSGDTLRYFTATRPILYRHSASTTLIWSALVTEFYLLYSTVR